MFDLRGQTAGVWLHIVRLQYPEGVHTPLAASFLWQYADFCQDFDWEDHHIGC
jgi:hypothetical protein